MSNVSFTKEGLMELKNDELRKLCKERGLSVFKGKSYITKAELVEKLVNYSTEHGEEIISQNVEQNVEEVKDSPVVEEVKEEEIIPWKMGNKDSIIDAAEVGTLIAFIDDKGKPRTGKLVNRSSKRKIVKLVTEFDWEFDIPYNHVLWVRNGTRWPKIVYTMLKEYKNGRPVNIIYEEN